jgi:hypothetical protein
MSGPMPFCARLACANNHPLLEAVSYAGDHGQLVAQGIDPTLLTDAPDVP